MAHIIEGGLSGKGKRVGIVVSRFNESITKMLLDGALNFLRRAGVLESDLEVVWVPGSFEIPLALKALAVRKDFDALIAIGCIIRGETSNYEHISQAVTDGVSRVGLDHGVPIGFAVLTVESFEQAASRSGGKFGNKGREAAESALETANVVSQCANERKRESVRFKSSIKSI